MEEIDKALIRAMEKSPGSLRALAQEARVSQATLSGIRSGKRTADAAVARAVAEALARWEARCWEAERLLRKTLEDVEAQQKRMKKSIGNLMQMYEVKAESPDEPASGSTQS